jgi:hypothetical protein
MHRMYLFVYWLHSERISKTDASGEQLKEAQSINKSLSALGDVIAALGERSGKKSSGGGGGGHIPFRNSKLTYLLQPSLQGDGKVSLFIFRLQLYLLPIFVSSCFVFVVPCLTYCTRWSLVVNQSSNGLVHFSRAMHLFTSNSDPLTIFLHIS